MAATVVACIKDLDGPVTLAFLHNSVQECCQNSDALAGKAGALPEAEVASLPARPSISGNLEEAHKAEQAAVSTPGPAVTSGGEKSFVLNAASRKIHIVRAGAKKALCGGYSVEAPAARSNFALQGRAWQGKDCTPCGPCRAAAEKRGLFRNPLRRGSDRDAPSSSSADSSDPE